MLKSSLKLLRSRPLLSGLVVSALNAMQGSGRLRSAKYRAERAIVRGLGNDFFDADHYRKATATEELNRRQALDHYIRQGWRDGINPHQLFDTNYYIAAQDGYPANVNPITHYLLVGQRSDASPSPWFDRTVYRARNDDVLKAGFEPYEHFLKFGMKEDRISSSRFDPDAYFKAYPDATQSGLPALAHFLSIGAAEGKKPIALTLESEPEVFLPGPLRSGWRDKVLGVAMQSLSSRPALSNQLVTVMRSVHKVPMLRNVKRWIERAAILELGSTLFDVQHYREACNRQRDPAFQPLDHFTRYGWKNGRSPHPLFDADYYIRAHDEFPEGTNPLVHFLLVGRHKKTSPSPWFDYDMYEKHNADVAHAGLDSFDHFLRFGLFENRASSSDFDPKGYLTNYPDACTNDQSALLHYLTIGRAQGRNALFVQESQDPILEAFRARTPRNAVDGKIWLARICSLPVPKPSRFDETKIDIVVPVYKDYDLTLECLYQALLTTQGLPVDVVAVDDCSPEPELSKALRKIADRGYIELIVNSENQGFVRSVNSGMRRRNLRDIILLNSDAMVFGNWVERLRNVAYSEEKISSVTPLTNSGTICSYPYFLQDYAEPLETEFEEIDRIAEAANAGQYVDAPTAVGFCMYIKRAAIDDVGYFDEASFGTGYGEENDFCLRCQANGWRDVIATDTFVRHVGGASFQGQKAERVRNALAVLDKRYPSYHRDVQAYCKDDPAKPFRAQIDMARLNRKLGQVNVLLISHNRGGGTEQHIQDRVADLSARGTSVFRLSAVKGTGTVALSHNDIWDVPNIEKFDLTRTEERNRLTEVLKALEISEFDIHHLGDFSPEGARAVFKLIEETEYRFTFTAHDYLSICPRINLVDENGHYCGEPDEAGCSQCLRSRGSDYGAPDIAAWREGYRDLLQAADRVIVPNEDVSDRLRRYFDDVTLEAIPHDAAKHAPARWQGAIQSGTAPLRIGIIGAISPIKGLGVIQRAAQEAHKHNHPLQFVVLGYTSDDVQSSECGIEVLGSYENDAVQEMIQEAQLDAIFLPSTWPETYSYTLSIALESGLPIVAFDIGAIERRLRITDRKMILPLEVAKDPVQICQKLMMFLAYGSRLEVAE